MNFRKEDFLPHKIFQKITDLRIQDPDNAVEVAKRRKRRERFAPDGRMNIVAADHPARGSLSVGEEPFAMADRHDLLARIISVLRSEWVDGILASMDLLEELLMIHGMMEAKEEGFLDQKILITSLNRGGLRGSVWELDDPITGTDAETCHLYGIDAVKMLLRIDLTEADSLKTMIECVRGVNNMNRRNLPVILEPLPVTGCEGGYRVLKEADPLIQLTGVTSALGSSSRNLWLKIPYTEDFERVLKSTTLPVVILGGNQTSLQKTLQNLKRGLNAGHQARGAMYGRNVLYPQKAEPAEVAEAIGRLVHQKSLPATASNTKE